MIDFTARFVDDLGYLPMLIIDGIEVYRGEYRPTLLSAFILLQQRIEFINEKEKGL